VHEFVIHKSKMICICRKYYLTLWHHMVITWCIKKLPREETVVKKDHFICYIIKSVWLSIN
jgi:hypothetical protein